VEELILPSKLEALGSISSIREKKRKKERGKEERRGRGERERETEKLASCTYQYIKVLFTVAKWGLPHVIFRFTLPLHNKTLAGWIMEVSWLCLTSWSKPGMVVHVVQSQHLGGRDRKSANSWPAWTT
jgi:hypothetical protein